jgi:hypothetical protein
MGLAMTKKWTGHESPIEPRWLEVGDHFVSKVLSAGGGTREARVYKRVYGTVLQVIRRYVDSDEGWEVRLSARALVVVRLKHDQDRARDKEPVLPHESEITYSEVLRVLAPEEFAAAERLGWPMNADLSRERRG